VNCSDQRAFIDQELAMSRLRLSVCTLAAFGMAGCTTYYDPPPPVAVTPTTGAPGSSASSAWKPGAGVIQTISLATPAVQASASAGGTTSSAVSGPYRVSLRMDDGTVQTLLVDNRAFLVGDRVQVTPEGRMIRQQ
jgi:predicted component of type VI protein secretion system